MHVYTIYRLVSNVKDLFNWYFEPQQQQHRLCTRCTWSVHVYFRMSICTHAHTHVHIVYVVCRVGHTNVLCTFCRRHPATLLPLSVRLQHPDKIQQNYSCYHHMDTRALCFLHVYAIVVRVHMFVCISTLTEHSHTQTHTKYGTPHWQRRCGEQHASSSSTFACSPNSDKIFAYLHRLDWRMTWSGGVCSHACVYHYYVRLRAVWWALWRLCLCVCSIVSMIVWHKDTVHSFRLTMRLLLVGLVVPFALDYRQNILRMMHARLIIVASSHSDVRLCGGIAIWICVSINRILCPVTLSATISVQSPYRWSCRRER